MGSGKRIDEWWEIDIPSSDWNLHQKHAYEAVVNYFPIPKKLWGRLYSVGGIRQQESKLLLHLFPRQEAAFQPEYKALDVLFEDDFCMVVNKPAGMPVHPSEIGQGGSLANVVAGYYASTGQACSVRHIHRLDSDTTGAVLYAKNEIAHMRLDEAMREQRIDRQYAAIVEGVFSHTQGTINEPIGRDRHQSGKRRVSSSGDKAITHYRVWEQFAQAALVRLELETGRTHQIRVHLSHKGHPLVGDSMYGGSTKRLQRQALHGERLLFDHPITGEALNLCASWPPDLVKLLADLKA